MPPPEPTGPVSDPIRPPGLHFTATQGWINDPLGLTYHDGRYHLFFQFVPDQVVWGPQCRWGHAVSQDLLTWTERPVALAPGDGDDGCWSGSVVVDDAGQAILFYTSVQLVDLQRGRVRIARPDDVSWDTWVKGPVVAEPPFSHDLVAYRDPYVFWDGSRWQMVIGAGRADGTPVALLRSSADLVTWTDDGELLSRSPALTNPVWMGQVWECPQLIAVDGKHVLLVSVWELEVPHYQAYAIGRYADGRFTPESWGRLSYGPSYYAGSVFFDADARPGIVSWLRGLEDSDGRWVGAISLPHLLRRDGTRLVAEPHPNLATRRREVLSHESHPAPRFALPYAADLEWALAPGEAGSLSVTAGGGADVLSFSVRAATLRVRVREDTWEMPFLGSGLRIVLDGPAVEIFGAAGVFAAPIPLPPEHRELSVLGGELVAYELDGERDGATPTAR